MLHHTRNQPFKTLYKLAVTATTIFIVSINQLDAQQKNLFEAVRNNNLKEVSALLNEGANPNAYDDDSDNVLINAAIYASANCMKLLLQRKANPNLKNKYGQTPLMLCTHELDKMKLLLHYDADINAKSNSENTALSIACSEYGLYKNVKWLIDNGADALFKRWGG
ncbi:ankyrin repeat domain-containing protein [Ilyomonas limi]|uniref:Ankyrin repeat domain-containing protein n=1 Tax=Ilyomonas limi TaxID=2575867 RepID=A0A4U3KSV6_9BACT|nr:ankyrin repeat domain-containing protein [Ilyomonas limi]TKK65391.1 ankyrin repeat domain-containing protein [Ilyomonas limi]